MSCGTTICSSLNPLPCSFCCTQCLPWPSSLTRVSPVERSRKLTETRPTTFHSTPGHRFVDLPGTGSHRNRILLTVGRRKDRRFSGLENLDRAIPRLLRGTNELPRSTRLCEGNLFRASMRTQEQHFGSIATTGHTILQVSIRAPERLQRITTVASISQARLV